MTRTGKKVHTREIYTSIYEGASDSIIVEGMLRDERLVESYRHTGDRHSPETVHHMLIRMELRLPQLIIEDIEVEMPTIPHSTCIETRESLAAIKGLPIVSGFTTKARTRLGGTQGCCHLLALLMAMASAAVQGAWSKMSQEPFDPATMPGALKRVVNTCRVWREDGPLVQEWQAIVAQAAGKNKSYIH